MISVFVVISIAMAASLWCAVQSGERINVEPERQRGLW